MSKSLVDLQLERGRLLERIASQRVALQVQLAPLQTASAFGDRTVSVFRSAVQYVRARPVAALLVVSALVLLRPRGAMRWVQRGLFVWRSWRAVRALVPPGLWGMVRQSLWR